MRDQYTNMMKMGPLNKIMEMLPGMGQAARYVCAWAWAGGTVGVVW